MYPGTTTARPNRTSVPNDTRTKSHNNFWEMKLKKHSSCRHNCAHGKVKLCYNVIKSQFEMWNTCCAGGLVELIIGRSTKLHVYKLPFFLVYDECPAEIWAFERHFMGFSRYSFWNRLGCSPFVYGNSFILYLTFIILNAYLCKSQVDMLYFNFWKNLRKIQFRNSSNCLEESHNLHVVYFTTSCGISTSFLSRISNVI